MRRPVLYLAGLFMATGASLALAGPAQAAVSHSGAASAKATSSHDWCDDDDDDFYYRGHHRHRHHHRYFYRNGGFNRFTYNNGFLNGNSIAIF